MQLLLSFVNYVSLVCSDTVSFLDVDSLVCTAAVFVNVNSLVCTAAFFC